MTTGDHRTTDVPPKGTLFCPECDHRSRYDGDWNVVGVAGTDRYRCPDCGTEITRRPSVSDDHRPAERLRSARRAWERSFRAWNEFWCRALGPRTDR